MKAENILRLDRHYANSTKIEIRDFEKREHDILERIKKHYSHKLNRKVNNEEAKEIANNLLSFAQAIYGT